MSKTLINILLTEDDPIDAKRVIRFLKQGSSPFFNFQITQCENLHDTIAQVSKNFYDTILLDLHLPDSIGLDTLEQVAAITDQPIIVMTSLNDQELAVYAVKKGAQDYLVKDDLNPDSLARSIAYSIHRKEAEIRSKSDQEKFKKIFMYAHDGILILDGRGNITESNPAAHVLLDAETDLLRSNLSRLLPKNDLEDLKKEAIVNHHAFTETIVKKFNGQTFPAEVSLTLFEDRTQNMQCVFRDITSRKHLEELKEQFASTVSHEMRTPLAVISGVIENLDDGIEGELNKGQKHLMEVASNSLHRLHRIINDLLDLSRLESGIAKVNITNAAIKEILEEIKNAFEKIASKKNITITIDCDPANITAFADPDLVYQGINNFMGNAVRYAKSHITLSAKELKNNAGKDVIRVSVIDDGDGIAETELNHLFDKYFQVSRTKGKEAGYKGTGLGLAICKELANVQNAEVSVNSTVGKGSEFFFDLQQYNEPIHFWQILEKEVCEKGSKTSPVCLISIQYDSATPDQVITLAKQHFTKHFQRRSDRIFLASEAKKMFFMSSTDRTGAQILCQKLAKATQDIFKKENLPDLQEPKIKFGVFPIDTDNIANLIEETEQSPPFNFLSDKKRKVLIIDDDGNLVQLMISQFQRNDYIVDHASNGESGIEKTRDFEPDAIILDVFMDKIDGWEVCKQLRAQEQFKNVPIIMITGNYNQTLEARAKELGANSFLPKPISIKEIINRVNDYTH